MLAYIPIILPLVAGAIFALVIFIKGKADRKKALVIIGGFVAIAVAAAVNLALNGGIGG